jgi:hypothetical protein
MTEQWKPASYKRVQEAVTELKGLIRAKYPDAKFQLARDPDQRRAWFLWTLVDGQDPEIVADMTRDRELEMIVEDHIPLHVIPSSDRGMFVKPPKDAERWKWASYHKVREAADELKATIAAAHPEAVFKLVRAPYQPVGWDLRVMVDVEDPEDVTGLVIDRVVEMLAEEHIPLHVVVRRPVASPVRAGAKRARKAS